MNVAIVNVLAAPIEVQLPQAVVPTINGLEGLTTEDAVWLLLYLSLVALADLLYSWDHVSSTLDVVACLRDVGSNLEEMAKVRAVLQCRMACKTCCEP
jgi:hypothetical protein